jgi:uncharacterized membrane protein
VIMVMNLLVSLHEGNFLPDRITNSFSRRAMRYGVSFIHVRNSQNNVVYVNTTNKSSGTVHIWLNFPLGPIKVIK